MTLLSITEFIGRFHPLLVHLPIGILLIALLFQWLCRKERYRSLQQAVPVIFLCGIISSAAACITGYLLSTSDDYNEETVNWHMWMGISVLLVAVLLYLKELDVQISINKRMLSIGLFILIAVTGHLGGSLTHGSGYITQPLKNIFIKDSTASMVILPVANVQEALVYNDVVRPILQTKCSSCHNSDKKKGGLRMDEFNEMMKGGKNGPVLEPGNAEASEMIRRLLLPVDNDKHMPPKEKPQPSENQVALLHWWITNGAGNTGKVKELDQPEKIKPVLIALQHPNIPVKKAAPDLPAAAVEKADEKIMAQLQSRGIIILPVAQNSNYLSANFVTHSILDKTDLELLLRLKKQLVWLRLDNSNAGDITAPDISQLTSLTRLNISNTLFTDKGVQQIASLKNLQYLNLAGTKVTAAGLIPLKPLTKLKNLYLFQTKTKSTDYANLEKIFPAAYIDTGGYRVATLIGDTTLVKAGKLPVQ